MIAAEHLRAAQHYALQADEHWENGHSQAARTAAELGRLHLDLHRELILRETLAGHQDATVHPLARFKRKAPATQLDSNPPGPDTNPHQEA